MLHFALLQSMQDSPQQQTARLMLNIINRRKKNAISRQELTRATWKEARTKGVVPWTGNWKIPQVFDNWADHGLIRQQVVRGKLMLKKTRLTASVCRTFKRVR